MQRSLSTLKDFHRAHQPQQSPKFDLRPLPCQEVLIRKLDLGGNSPARSQEEEEEEEEEEAPGSAVPMDLSDGEIGDSQEEDGVADYRHIEDQMQGQEEVNDDSDKVVPRCPETEVCEAHVDADDDQHHQHQLTSNPDDVNPQDVRGLIPRHFNEELEALQELAHDAMDQAGSDDLLPPGFEAFDGLPSPIAPLDHDDGSRYDPRDAQDASFAVPQNARYDPQDDEASFAVPSTSQYDSRGDPRASCSTFTEGDSRFGGQASYSVVEYYDDTNDDLGKNSYHLHMCTDQRIDPEFRSFSRVDDGDVASIPLPSYPSPYEKKSSAAWTADEPAEGRVLVPIPPQPVFDALPPTPICEDDDDDDDDVADDVLPPVGAPPEEMPAAEGMISGVDQDACVPEMPIELMTESKIESQAEVSQDTPRPDFLSKENLEPERAGTGDIPSSQASVDRSTEGSLSLLDYPADERDGVEETVANSDATMQVFFF